MAAQLMATNGLRLRDDSRCSASATSSLPDPVGPSISTGVNRGATRRTRRLISIMQGALPISSGSRSAQNPIRLRCSGRMGIGLQRAPRKFIAFESDASRLQQLSCGSSTFGISSTVGAVPLRRAAFHATPSFSWLLRSA